MIPSLNNNEAPIEVTIDELKAEIAKLEVIVRLADHPDFQKAIIQGYLRDEPARLAGLLADPTVVASEEAQRDVQNQLTSVGYLRRYLATAHNRLPILQRDLEGHMQEQQDQLADIAAESSEGQVI